MKRISSSILSKPYLDGNPFTLDTVMSVDDAVILSSRDVNPTTISVVRLSSLIY